MRTPTLLVLATAALGTAAALLVHDDSQAFTVSIHTDLTREALESDAVSRTIDGEEQTFSEIAILEVQAANTAEDTTDDALKAAHHCDDERLRDASLRLRNLRSRMVSDLSGGFPDGFSARRRLGSALHTLQDFYSHTNWVELGNTAPETKLGKRLLRSPSAKLRVCADDQATLTGAGLQQLTSGYFDFPDPCSPAPPGKCLHGGDDCAGIHKDDAGRPGFDAARALALRASIDYVNLVLDDLAGNDRAIRALMGRTFPFGLVIDDSLSMTPELDSVRTSLKNVVQSAPSLSDADDFLLSIFGPTVGPVRRTADRAEFVTWLDELAPRGDPGDGAEPTQVALLAAVADATPGSTIFLVTDAEASDAELAPAVAAAARLRNVRLVLVLSGPDAQADPTYRANAAATGGVALHVAESEAGPALEHARALFVGGLDPVIAADGTLSAPLDLPFPVEQGATNLLVTANVGTNAAVTLRRPGGAAVADADDDARVTTFTGGAAIEVSDPAAGTWTLHLEGDGAYSARASLDGTVNLRGVRFVRRGAGPHGGLAELTTEPSSGAEVTLSAVLTGAAPDPTFLVTDAGGATLFEVDLVQADPDAGADRYVGTFTAPAVPFRIAAQGDAASGGAFRRVHAPLHDPTRIDLRVDRVAVVGGVPAGHESTVAVTVRNDGPEATFDLAAVDEAGFVSAVEPAQVVLGSGAEAEVLVRLDVPEDAARDRFVLLSVVASEADGSDANALALELPVTGGTLDFGRSRVRIRDRSKAGKDLLIFRGKLAWNPDSPEGRFDPADEDLVLEIGDAANPLTITIPAGDPGWSVNRRGKLRWRSEAGATPRIALRLDPVSGNFLVKVQQFDFTGSPKKADFRVTLRAGEDFGSTR